MSRKLLPASATAVLLASTAMADVPSVAVDIAPVHSLVAQVMEGVGTPDLIVPAEASPHEFSLRPSAARALQDANVVFWVGEDLTPWMEDALENLTGDATVVTLLELDETKTLPFRESALFEAHAHGDEDHDDHEGHDDHSDHDDHAHEVHDDHADHDDHDHKDHDDHADHDGHDDHDDHAHDDHDDHAEEGHDDHDHSDHDDHKDHDDHDHADHDDHEGHHDHDDHAGHDHGDHDPHVWLSPDNASAWLNVIAARLSAADPENASSYFSNAAKAQGEIAALKAEISEILEPVRGQDFIVFHDAYQYFEVAFDFPAAGAISLSDATDPSPARIKEIQGRIQNEGIECVLSEPQFNPNLVTTVLDGTEANRAVSDPLGAAAEEGPALYSAVLRNLATALGTCLK